MGASRLQKRLAAFAVVLAATLGGVAAGAQESSLRFERTVDYRTGRAQDLKARVGPIRVDSVEFRDLGRGSAGGGIAGRFRGPGGSASEASTTIRGHFLAENPTDEEWEIAFTLEFLDRDGKLIDRVTKRATWEGEAKPYDFDHQILEYVVPAIAQVRIKLEGRLD